MALALLEHAVTFTTVQTDVNGAGDIEQSRMVISTSTATANSVFCYYSSTANKMYLRKDDGSDYLPGFAPGSANVISNSRASINCAGSTVTRVGNTLTIKWKLTFTTAHIGTQNIYLHAKDAAIGTTWDNLGTYTITGAAGAGNGTSGNSASSSSDSSGEAIVSASSVVLSLANVEAAGAAQASNYKVSVQGVITAVQSAVL